MKYVFMIFFLFLILTGCGNYGRPFQNNLTPGECILEITPLKAKVQNGIVILKWQTIWEKGNKGFNIHKSTNKTTGYKTINTSLIPTLNMESGSVYSFTDTKVQPGMTYYYSLENIDICDQNTQQSTITVLVPVEKHK